MKLSNVIIDYRNRMQISQREFARRCGLSNSYISFIENEYNPRTGKPIVPTIEQYQKIASCMSLSLQQLFEMLDEDSPVELHQKSFSSLKEDPQIHAVSTMMESMSKDQKDQILAIVRAYASTQRKD